VSGGSAAAKFSTYNVVGGGAANLLDFVGTATGLSLSGMSGSFSGSAQGGNSTPFGIIPSGYIGGITMIRAG